jgi:hypothetical protein
MMIGAITCEVEATLGHVVYSFEVMVKLTKHATCGGSFTVESKTTK